MDNTIIFDTILEQNGKYADLIGANAPKALQEAQLQVCDELFENLILKTGLVEEYAKYCKIKRL